MTKVLLASDGSAHSIRAARHLGEMARKDPTLMVTVFHVAPLPETMTAGGAAGVPLTLPLRLDEYLQTQTERVMEMTLEALALPPERVRTSHVLGIPGEAILNEARQGGYGLIVIGRRGLSPLKELFLGSVSQAVLHSAPCPILIVP